MLILPPGHAASVQKLRPLAAREKRLLAAVLAALAAILVVVVVSIATAGKASSDGCIYATVAGPVGAEQISQCGAAARETCATALTPGAFTPQSAATVTAECRKAGLPVGR